MYYTTKYNDHRVPQHTMSTGKSPTGGGDEGGKEGDKNKKKKEKKKETASDKLNKDQIFQAAAAMTSVAMDEPGRRRTHSSSSEGNNLL